MAQLRLVRSHPVHQLASSWSGWSLNGRIAAGCVVFVVLALLGLQLLIRGIRDDIYDWLGHASISRLCFVTCGIVLQLPLIAWIVFLIHQGWFAHVSSP